MAEKGHHTSSMTSVTEEDSSVGSESDTTESTNSNVTSSVLSSTDTDDKLTPSLGGISLSAETDSKDQSQSSKGRHRPCESKVGAKGMVSVQDSTKIMENSVVSQHGQHVKHSGSLASKNTVNNKKRKLKDRNLLHSVLRHPHASLNINNSAVCHENLGVDDLENKLSTDFSDTSSLAVADAGTLYYPGEEAEDSCNDVDCSPEQQDAEEEDTLLFDSQTEPDWEPDMNSNHWYQAGCFDRYWRHYSFVMSWYRAHMDAVYRLRSDMSAHAWGGMPALWGVGRRARDRPRQPGVPRGCGVGGRSSSRQSRKARRARQRRSAKARQRAAKAQANAGQAPGSGQDDNGTSPGAEEDEVEMEITEEMLDFFKTSLKHKMERDSTKFGATADGAEAETRMNIEDAAPSQSAPSTAAPQERPGARRALEMKQLYGPGAPMIHGMETALQMTFDRIQDKFQPKLWPNMPLKIVFG